MSRYFIQTRGHSEHSAAAFEVADRSKPFMVAGKHYKGQYDTVCACWNIEDAEMICKALNASQTATKASREWSND